jgi:RNA polymerase sigma factor (sigma-70 family)
VDADQRRDQVKRARAGDGRAFDELLAPVLDPAFRLAMTMLNDRSAAEDAVQEAALKTWRKLGKFRPDFPARGEGGPEGRMGRSNDGLRPWFLAIVANECRTARRGRWWRVIRSGDANRLSPETSSDRGWADHVDLDVALDRLAPTHLLALSLYYHLDLPIEEVARVLGCSVGGARQRIHRALVALRPGMAIEVNG